MIGKSFFKNEENITFQWVLHYKFEGPFHSTQWSLLSQILYKIKAVFAYVFRYLYCYG